MADLTHILESIDQGDPHAAEELLPMVYDQLRQLARNRMAKLPPGQTLQPTALVHEAWQRLRAPCEGSKHWENRGHFFAAAAESMRRILVDQARRKARLKRGNNAQHVDIDALPLAAPSDNEKILEINEALGQYEKESPEKATIVKLKFFSGLTNEEVASLMNLSEKTVRRHWAIAKTWLYERIHAPAGLDSSSDLTKE